MAGIPEGFGYDDFAANNPPAGIDPSSWRASIYSKRDDSDSRENNSGFFEKLYQDSLRGVHKQGEGKYLNYEEIESGITIEKHQAKGGFIGKEIAGAGTLVNIAASEAGKAYAKTLPSAKAITDIGLRGVGEVISLAGKGITNFAIASSYDEALQMSGGKLKASDWDNRATDALQKSKETILENTTDGQRTMAGIVFGAVGGFVTKQSKLHNASKLSKSVDDFNIGLKDSTHPSTFVGHKAKEIEVLHGTNRTAIIDDIVYSGHALDRMQGRGFTPTIIKDIIQNGQKFEAKAGRTGFYSKELNTTVITEKNGKIVTLGHGTYKKGGI